MITMFVVARLLPKEGLDSPFFVEEQQGIIKWGGPVDAFLFSDSSQAEAFCCRYPESESLKIFRVLSRRNVNTREGVVV